MNRPLKNQIGCRKTLALPVWAWPVIIGALALWPGLTTLADDTRLGTATELREMHAAGEYRICLQQIARVLRSGSAAQGQDRYDLLLLRGDCLLRLDDPATAQLAYAAAAKSPVAEQAREGRAVALLLQRSTQITYRPRSPSSSGEGINLASMEGRTKALRALLEDELRSGQAELRDAMNAENLVPIRDVLPKLADLYAVEKTATGSDTQTRPILEATGQRARTLIDRELDVCEQSVTGFDRRANRWIEGPGVARGWWWGGYARRGLYSRDRRELRDLIDYLSRIAEAAGLGQQLAASFDGDAKAWDPLIARASKAVSRARDVLEAE